MKGWGSSEPGGSAKKVTGREDSHCPGSGVGEKAIVGPRQNGGRARLEHLAGAAGRAEGEPPGWGWRIHWWESEVGATEPPRQEWSRRVADMGKFQQHLTCRILNPQSKAQAWHCTWHLVRAQEPCLGRVQPWTVERPRGPGSTGLESPSAFKLFYCVILGKLLPLLFPTAEDKGCGGPRMGKGQV